MKTIKIPEELLRQIANYLIRRPFIEVADFLSKIQRLSEPESEKENKDD